MPGVALHFGRGRIEASSNHLPLAYQPAAGARLLNDRETGRETPGPFNIGNGDPGADEIGMAKRGNLAVPLQTEFV